MHTLTRADLLNLTLDDFKTDPPVVDGPGCYVALDCDGGVLYVGQSKAIQTRTEQHSSKSWAGEVAEWRYLLLAGGPDARLTAETGLILRYRPRHNRAIKIGLRKDGGIYEMQFLRSKRS